MATFFGAIADDFTGATDLAGLIARSGAQVTLRIGVPKAAPQETSAFEIIALKSRTAPVRQAIQESRSALEWLRSAGAKRFFFKYCSTFDSTPAGNIGPVAEELMSVLDIDQTIYCPAFPENGRSIFMGNLFVGEQPLSESPMKDHPLTPMRDSNLMRLLRPQVSHEVGLVNRLSVAQGPSSLRDRLAELRRQGVAHVVVDAVANADLETIAQACHDMVLITGGSALAMPLPEIWSKLGEIARSDRAPRWELDSGPAIVLSGSCSAMTNRQVSNFVADGRPALRLDPVDIAENGPAAACRWLELVSKDQSPIIFATAEPAQVKAAQEKLGVGRAGSLVENALAICAIRARELGFRRFVVAGGETSGAVTKALGIEQLLIGKEIAPGVPWCFAESAGHHMAIALKSGNFGDEGFFRTALDLISS